MHHIGTITKSTRHATREFHGECSCGTAGDFTTKESAASYLQFHFGKQGGIDTHELVDNSDKPEAKPVLPTTHVGGVGELPATHAGPPAPPPAPPSASELKADK
jgi:hypothetical protein